MIARRHFVSITDTAGRFTGRGMVGQARALELLDGFVAAGNGGRAVFAIISDHDGRIELHRGRSGLSGVVTARAARPAALGGILPARDAVVWQVKDLSTEEAKRVVISLYALSADAFRIAVERELTG